MGGICPISPLFFHMGLIGDDIHGVYYLQNTDLWQSLFTHLF